ncbi:hypothetical protein Micbo1qcDRAFT_50067 [Microdochium bolleyi]|uniref:Uncharacterized protein n=1 Tax=Microdochium bolleyi TaxID=196109 RepID=A0A136J683_9PEZI|nr:hypothetical protein Micbo1qcDRAFT_50067 [Microdochium bolleyi]
MRNSTIFPWMCCGISTSRAAAIIRDDPYTGDLRTFGETGCFTDNQGVGTVTLSMANKCTPWPLSFNSIYVHGFEGWQFLVHATKDCSDLGCLVEPTDAGNKNVVCASVEDEGPWIAYSVAPAV